MEHVTAQALQGICSVNIFALFLGLVGKVDSVSRVHSYNSTYIDYYSLLSEF